MILMDDVKIIEVLGIYEEHLHKKGIQATEASHDRCPVSKRGAWKHLLCMIHQIRQFLIEGRREKAFRWLGFIQGTLWTTGEFTINELMEHNKPKDQK